jgi:hypothetical protein
MRALAARADLICTISHAEKERLLRHGYQSDAAPHPRDPPRGKPGVPAGRKLPRGGARRPAGGRYRLPTRYILYVGRLNVRKNIAGCCGPCRNCTTGDTGGGGRGQRLENGAARRLIADLKLADRICFTATCPMPTFPASLRWLRCFVSPPLPRGSGCRPWRQWRRGAGSVANTTSLPRCAAKRARTSTPADPASVAAALNRLLTTTAMHGTKGRWASAGAPLHLGKGRPGAAAEHRESGSRGWSV